MCSGCAVRTVVARRDARGAEAQELLLRRLLRVCACAGLLSASVLLLLCPGPRRVALDLPCSARQLITRFAFAAAQRRKGQGRAAPRRHTQNALGCRSPAGVKAPGPTTTRGAGRILAGPPSRNSSVQPSQGEILITHHLRERSAEPSKRHIYARRGARGFADLGPHAHKHALSWHPPPQSTRRAGTGRSCFSLFPAPPS